ncbi:MAG: hypothetical protein N3G21_13645 [Candidatus Hydrogenedentes bacterium]|nr:hypothetical protein [Candidatus Hydrogenedentota bacterium]
MSLEKSTQNDNKYLVVCQCGQTFSVVNPELHPLMTCGVCGRQIKVTPENIVRSPETNTGLYKTMRNRPPNERITESIRLIYEGKLSLAKPILLSVMEDLIPIREAFYVLGYCYYKEQKLLESFIYLGVAVMLGHPNAKGLFDKVKSMLNMGDTSFISKFG